VGELSCYVTCFFGGAAYGPDRVAVIAVNRFVCSACKSRKLVEACLSAVWPLIGLAFPEVSHSFQQEYQISHQTR
jgi:hypothetical protein